MTKEQFDIIMQSIPHQPGCYKYYSKEDELLYVGKAKDLRKRVSSYFVKNHDNYKTRKLVSLIHSIDFTVTDTEHDAFLLENSLIKHYQPHYNISLKDDKTYPYIVIKKEPFPRVFFTRRIIKDGSEYLGPFTSLWRLRELLETIKQSIPLRTCNLNLTESNIKKGKFQVCLEYHIGNCKAPCVGLQNEEEYKQNLQYVRHILKGNFNDLLKELKKDMNDFSTNLEFEKAQIIKKKIEYLQSYQSKSTIVNPKMENADVACIIQDEQNYYVNYMMVSKGTIIHSKTLLINKQLDETEEDVLSLALDNLKETFQSNAEETIVPIPINVVDGKTIITVPKAGDKKKLLELALKNAEIFKDEIKRKEILHQKELTETERVNKLEVMQQLLQLPELPVHIECFDNSNFQGSNPVAAMVCYKNGWPSKKDYIRFHIKTVEGINDFASMSEIVYRRYKKVTEENLPIPQLIIIDGGKGQLGAAIESLEKLGLLGKMTIVGLAKREESIFFPGDKEPLQLPINDPTLLLIRQIRDEVHRFGISFHRQVRSKTNLESELEGIPGIGDKTFTLLLQTFRSVNNIKTITERELAKVIGASKARKVWNFFHEDKQ